MISKTDASSTEVKRIRLFEEEVDPGQKLPLPHEILIRIFSYLRAKEVVTCAAVSRQFNECATDNSVWRDLFTQAFPLCREPLDRLNYREAYKKCHAFDKNLRTGFYTSRTFEKGEQNEALSLTISGGYLYAMSGLEMLKAWDLKTGLSINLSVIEDQGECLFLRVVEAILYTSSFEGTIKAWDLKTGRCIHCFEGHQALVTSLITEGGIFYSASRDHKIKAWDLKTGLCMGTLEGYHDEGCSLAAMGGILYIAANSMIEAWDVKQGTLKTFIGHEKCIFSLGMGGETLYSASEDATIKAWDTKTTRCIATFEGHDTAVLSLAFAERVLYSGSEDGSIKIWDLNGTCINTVKGDGQAIISLANEEGILCSASVDGTIKVWNFNPAIQ